MNQPDGRHIGQRIRDLRQDAKISARELAKSIGVSPGFVSLLESGKSSASVATLRSIASALGQPFAALFDEETPAEAAAGARAANSRRGASGGPPDAVRVVRKANRKRLEIPGSHFRFELLSPDLQGAIEFVMIELEPSHPPTSLRSHLRGGEECAIVLAGTMGLTVGDEYLVLEAGDSVRFDPSVPHRIENLGTTTLIQISAITPPSF